MKELTIEEKAIAYDEALKQIKECTPDENGFITIYPQEIFPELKESEDESIRKELISHFSGYKANCSSNWYGIKVDSILAWLEKQGEQKPIIEMKSAEESLGIDSETYNKIVDECIYGEQKPTDKVEPKFKVDDWVVYDHNAYQVVELPKEGYINLGLKRNGKIEFAPSPYCRPWTIQDAKEGDVLCYRDGKWCFIYKGIVTEDTFKYYALLSEKGITVNDAAFNLLTSCITPATKEQRDLLFKKMKEASYEWDAEKKQLKKIESKTAWSEEDEIVRSWAY